MSKIKKICPTCNKEFYVFKYRENTARFCSLGCSTTVLKKGHSTWLKGTKGLVKPNSGSFKKGLIPWNKGKKGFIPWNKGKKYLAITGDRHPQWKGGIKILSGYFYAYSPNHPNKSKQGYVALHRLIYEKAHNRFLNADEIIHHVNGNKQDNRIENLYLCSRQEHGKIHHISPMDKKHFPLRI
jgi:endogenous inhibitor of DNA gyrase (YacG/DUF329 family)